MRRELYDGQGNLLEATDTRTVAETAARQVARIKKACQVAIEATGLPWMAQRELSGGTPIPQDVKDSCGVFRAYSGDLEAQIADLVENAEGDDDLATCDVIEAITW